MKPKQNKVTRTLGKLRSRIAQVEQMRDDLINGRAVLRNARAEFTAERDEVFASNLKLVQRAEALDGNLAQLASEYDDIAVCLGAEKIANSALRRELYTARAEKHDARLALQQAQIAAHNAEARRDELQKSRDLNRYLFWSLLICNAATAAAFQFGLL